MIWFAKSEGSPDRSYRTLSILACQEPRVVPGLGGGAMPTSDQEVVSRFLQGDSQAVGTVDSWISRAAWPYQRRPYCRSGDVSAERRVGVAEGTLRVRVMRCREKAVALRRELGSEPPRRRNAGVDSSPNISERANDDGL